MKVYHNNCLAMHTRFDLVIANVNHNLCDTLFQEIQRELTHLENKLSYFLPSSEISKINREGANYPIRVDDETYSIISACINYTKLTQGAFDITFKPLLDLWKSEGDLENEVIENHLNHLGVDKLLLHPDTSSVELMNETIKLDLGGYAKGFAMDKAMKILKVHEIESAFISFGESSISVLGSHPHGNYWPAGIQNIYNKAESVYEFELINQSLSTSGSLQQEDNQHIISPLTGKPVEQNKTVSLVSDFPIEVEVLSTALLAANRAQKTTILNNFPTCHGVELHYHQNNIDQIIRLNEHSYELRR